jgi:hypothetical protein
MRKAASLLAVALPLVALAGAPAAASAAGLSAPVVDCNTHARLTHRYTVAQLRNALATMPADIKEYSDCGDVIQRQLLAQLGGLHGNGGSGTGSGGGSFLPTPVIVVLALVLLGGAGFAAYAWRRRG